MTSSSPSMVKGASLLIVLQLVSRLITLVANQLLLRFLTAPLLALSTQLEVYYLSVLFFARESLRVAVQRQAAAADAQALVNLGYLAVALGALVSVGLGRAYLAYATTTTTTTTTTTMTPHLVESLYLYGAAAMVELASEPCFVLMQARLRFGTRAAAESVATFVRCAVSLSCAVRASSNGFDAGVLPFALGQLSYGLSLLLVYLFSARRLAAEEGFSLLPRRFSAPNFLLSYFCTPTVSLAGSMMAQSVVKHLLTQGDTFLISVLSTPDAQGAYALANNYGGLLARLLFQPVEESSRSYFSRLLSGGDGAIQSAKRNLHTLFRSYILLSAVIVGLGPFAAPPLLSIVAGQRWASSGAGQVLGTYCFYIPFMALNGITESFVASVASETEVHSQSAWMTAFSLVFAASAFFFMRVLPLGAHGLVYANSINMLCRIVWSGAFISRFFKRRGVDFSLASLVPRTTVAASMLTFCVLYLLNVQEEAQDRPFFTLVKIAGSAVPFLCLIASLERKFLLECFHSIRGPKAAKQS